MDVLTIRETGDRRVVRRAGFRRRAERGASALAIAAALAAGQTGGAAAFPIDLSNGDQVPQGTELEAPDAQDLRHQLQLANGLGAPAGGGWTIVPRVDFQEMLTDNALQEHSPRQADLITVLSPGIHLAGDMPRLQLTLDYAPALNLYARTTRLNALTQDLNALGVVTVVPDLAFVDVRGLAGVHSLYGGIGGQGSFGAGQSATAIVTPQALAGTALSMNRDQEVQTSVFGVSPYLLKNFGDWGTGKLGYSINTSQSSALSGFASSPFEASGLNSQSLFSQEEVANWTSGPIFDRIQNYLSLDLMQNHTMYNGNTTALSTGAGTSSTSDRDFLSDKVTYQFDRAVAVFVSGGYENIVYSQVGQRPIHDPTWSFGTTLTPDAKGSLTISYGHLNGYNSLSANGYYAITSRTSVNGAYASTVGTQLENLLSQVNLATTGSNGSVVNSQTGGQVFTGVNALALQDGLFRFDTFTFGSTTILDRDTFSVDLFLSRQTRAGNTSAAASASLSRTASAQWIHSLQPNLTLSMSASYAIQDLPAGTGSIGNNRSLSFGTGLQYQISDTLSASLRYSLFERQAATTAYSFYQDMLILGISKSF